MADGTIHRADVVLDGIAGVPVVWIGIGLTITCGLGLRHDPCSGDVVAVAYLACAFLAVGLGALRSSPWARPLALSVWWTATVGATVLATLSTQGGDWVPWSIASLALAGFAVSYTFFTLLRAPSVPHRMAIGVVVIASAAVLTEILGWTGDPHRIDVEPLVAIGVAMSIVTIVLLSWDRTLGALCGVVAASALAASAQQPTDPARLFALLYVIVLVPFAHPILRFLFARHSVRTAKTSEHCIG